MILGSKIREVVQATPISGYLYTIAAIVSILPPLYYAFLIATTCSDSLSNDYLAIAPLICDVAKNGFATQDFVAKCFYGVHFALVPVLVGAVNCLLFDWSAKADLFLGLGLALVKTFLLWHCVKDRDRAVSALLLVLVSLVHFGGSQASVYLYGMTSVCWGFVTTGFVLALWGLVKLKNQTLALSVMLAGGLLSSYTEANVPPCWLALLLPLVALRVKTFTPLVVWFLGGLAGMAPYLYLALSKGPGVATSHPNLLNIKGLFDLLGRFLLNDTVTICSANRTAQIIGFCAFLLLAYLVTLLYRERHVVHRQRVTTAFSLIVYGLGSAYILAVFRNTIAPWYLAMTSLFWCGLLILLVECWRCITIPSTDSSKASVTSRSFLPTSILALSSVILFWLYCTTNFSYQDKDWFRRSHSPASQSVMLNYQMAPTYSVAALTSGELLDYDTEIKTLATIYQNGWVANTRHQRYTLQGDFVLPTVTLHQPQGSAGLFWITDKNFKQSASWDVPEHLNAVLPEHASVTWRLSLPAQTTEARMTTAVAVPVQTNAKMPDSSQWELQIEDLSMPSLNSRIMARAYKDWSKIDIDLLKHRGHDLNVSIKSNSGAVVLRFPQIQVNLTAPVKNANLKTIPGNIEGSAFFPQGRQGDLQISPGDDSLWQLSGLKRIKAAEAEFKALSTQPKMIYKPSLSLDISNYSHFCVGIAVPASVLSRNLCVQLTRNGTDIVQFLIPLVGGSKMQNYSYDLKLCNFKCGDKITGLTILPVYIQPDQSADAIKVGTIKFILRPQ